MIINKNQTPNAQYVGEIKANKVGIDTKNIDFVASLLTTNLYSNPIQSFLRETVSNGWDSHVEAGNEEPVIISLYSDNVERVKYISERSWLTEKQDITIQIRDYGVGLSPERFANIYTNIGSSTKRDSNDFIGAFGIGRFSCLSCADSAVLDSYYNGIKYSYLMYKDGQGINIDELGQFPTTSKNGLKVSVTIKCDYYTIKELVKAFESLAFFNCIYLDDSQQLLNNFANIFNNRQQKHYQNFSIWRSDNHFFTSSYYSTKPAQIQLIVGNCIYPLSKTSLLQQANLPESLNIYLRFDIGDLDITPNREAILYNPKTDNAIIEKAKKVVEELCAIIGTQGSIDFPDLLSWYTYHNSNVLELNLPFDEEGHLCKLSIKKGNISKWNLASVNTIKGEHITDPTDVLHILNNIFNYTLTDSDIKFYYNRDSQRYYSKVPAYKSYNILSLLQKGKVLVTTDGQWKEITKNYAAETYFTGLNKDTIAIVLLKNCIIKHMWRLIKALHKSKISDNRKDSIRFIFKHLKIEDYSTEVNFDTIPASYIKTWEDAKKAQRKAANATASLGIVRKCVIYTLVDGSRYDYESQETLPTLDSELYTLNSISVKTGTTFVYTTKDDLAYIQKVHLLYNRYLNHVIPSQLPVFIVVAPSNIITIANLTNTISLDEYMNTFNKEFSVLSSLSEDMLSNMRSLMSSYHHTEHLKKEYGTLYSTCSTYFTLYNKYYKTLHSSSPIIKDLITFIRDKYILKNWLDKNIINIQSNTKLFAFVDWIQFIDNDNNPKIHAIIADYVSRSGLSTLSTTVNKNYKQSDLFKHFI